MYKNYQSFHPLIFYVCTRLRGMRADRHPHSPPGHTIFIFRISKSSNLEFKNLDNNDIIMR